MKSESRDIGIIIMVVVTIMVFSFTGGYIYAQERVPNGLYPITTKVVGLDKETDSVIVQQPNGNIWTFTGIDDWEIGDTCNMIMNKNGTENIYDDIIVSVRYSM